MKAINVILALLVSFGLAFGIAELGLRLLGFAPPAINTEFDATLGWAKTPNSTIHRSTKEFDVTIETDAHGLRDDYAADIPAKPAGTQRILFLGDSFVLGYTVAREDLFVDRLERAWAAEGRNVEIVNAGTQAYSTDQALVWLQEHGAKFSLDAVVLFPYENDIWWNAQSDYLGSSKPSFGEDGQRVGGPLVETKKRGFFGSTAIGNLIKGSPKMPKLDATIGGESARVRVESTSRLKSPPAETLAAEARTAMLIRAMATSAAGMGAQFAVCPIPSREAVANGDGPAEIDPVRPHRLLVDAASGVPGAVTIDPIAPMRAAEKDGWDLYYDRDFHLNAAGNLVLAGVLKGALEDGGWVNSAAAPDQVAALLPAAGTEPPPAPPKPAPKWPFVYGGLVLALGTLYSRTYGDESPVMAYLKVAGLLAVVFATALGVTALMGILPPLYAKLLLIGLVIAVLTFVLYKLGDRVGTIAELLKAFTLRGHWYLMPLLTVLLTVGSLLVVAASSPLIAPFIYTLF